ncbi:uncharacterized protein EMH_0009370 [Eimeria mitis]|uniref:Uncharacterized protein n=1 Tax=Eimeria mitis TaxID=44415 RepID=U6K1C4_9EIME|nr:uncharacterized protein EMH_0009370 [Eimeria mitis]CDJ31530.1 hypothetical protein, conserved [Eimeria mitis]
MESYQVSTDGGSTSSGKTTEGSTADSGESYRCRMLVEELLESPAAPVESLVEGAQLEQVAAPTPQNPLAALAVYVDVNFSSALQMLRTAASVTVEEAKATLFSGSSGRLNIARRLHGRLEELWTRPYRQLKNVNVDKVRLLLGSLKRQDHRCGQDTPTLPPTDLSDEAAADRYTNTVDASLSCGLPAYSMDRFLSDSEVHCADALPTTWRPFRRDDGTIIAPPVELLAAFADSKSAHMPYSRNNPSTFEGQELWTSAQRTPLNSTVGCVVGLCVRSLLDLYIQAIRSLQPTLLPRGSVVLVTAVNVPMMFRVLEEHHLVVQPLDLDPHTLMPSEQILQQAVQCWGSRVKAVLCSHLYGGVCDLQPLVDFSIKHKLLLIEDCAESFVGELYKGHPWADVSLFSFGLIKTCTSAGGGIATVRFQLCYPRRRPKLGI